MRTPLNNRFAVPVLFVVLGTITLFAGSAAAQMNGFHGGGIAPRGVPASVTSFGFGGHPGFRGVPASVTSVGFGGRPGLHGVPASVTSLGFGAQPAFHGFRDGVASHGFGSRNHFHERPFDSRRRHHHFDGFYSPYYGGYYGYGMYAYPYDLNADDYTQADDYSQNDSAVHDPPSPRDYDDRRQLDEDYRAGLNTPRAQTSQQTADPVAPQPSTVLVFKDGHQQEISNYAIVGATLYDLSDGRTKKVQLADLNLPATVKQNDQRGVEFQLPAATAMN
jgi:hypothetical protein